MENLYRMASIPLIEVATLAVAGGRAVLYLDKAAGEFFGRVAGGPLLRAQAADSRPVEGSAVEVASADLAAAEAFLGGVGAAIPVYLHEADGESIRFYLDRTCGNYLGFTKDGMLMCMPEMSDGSPEAGEASEVYGQAPEDALSSLIFMRGIEAA